MTTLPAKAGSFRLVSEASARAGASRATHRATPHVSARRPDPGLLEQASTCQGNALAPGFLPSREEVSNAIPTAEHLKGSHGIGFTCGPPPHNRQPIGHVKVLLDRATTWVACQAGSALLPQPFACGDPHSLSGLQAGVPCGIYLWQTQSAQTRPGDRAGSSPVTVPSGRSSIGRAAVF